MSDELKDLLEALAVGIPVGLVLGLIIGIAGRKLFPDWVRRYAKSRLDRPWKYHAAMVVALAVLAVLAYLLGHPYLSALSLGACILALVLLLAFGFKPLTPKDEKRIDEWDPRKLWPPFW